MFGKPQIDLTQIRATSKLSLKMSCLAACGNDVDKAEKLYRFIAEDLSNLPVAEKPADDTPYMDTKGKKAPEGGK